MQTILISVHHIKQISINLNKWIHLAFSSFICRKLKDFGRAYEVWQTWAWRWTAATHLDVSSSLPPDEALWREKITIRVSDRMISCEWAEENHYCIKLLLPLFSNPWHPCREFALFLKYNQVLEVVPVFYIIWVLAAQATDTIFKKLLCNPIRTAWI